MTEMQCPVCKGKFREKCWTPLNISDKEGANYHAGAHLNKKERQLLFLIQQRGDEKELPEEIQEVYDEYRKMIRLMNNYVKSFPKKEQ